MKRKGESMEVIFLGITTKGTEKRVCVLFSVKERNSEGYVEKVGAGKSFYCT